MKSVISNTGEKLEFAKLKGNQANVITSKMDKHFILNFIPEYF